VREHPSVGFNAGLVVGQQTMLELEDMEIGDEMR